MTKAEIDELRVELLDDFVAFTQFFFKIRTGRDFDISYPASRKSHHLQIADKLERVLEHEITRLIINIAPRYGKTEMCIHFIAWSLANYPDSQFIYVSYGKGLAVKQTQAIREIVSHPIYQQLFGIKIKESSRAKGNFETQQGGAVYAAGAGGEITGRGAGIKGVKRFGGLIVIDDIHKPVEVTSDTIREGIHEWYLNTLYSRVNTQDTPIVFIGQGLHEDDLRAKLINGYDGKKWDTLILPSLDHNGNALYPEMHTAEDLLQMKDVMPYIFSAQFQHNPIPAGGAVFKEEWWVLLDEEPDILGTFITADTAETEKNYNDPTVFSFWGVYKLKYRGIEIGGYGLHWLDCWEIRVDPSELEDQFLSFYADCLMHKKQPNICLIEKKSTGVTLLSSLKKAQGIRARDTKNGNISKTQRFLASQPQVASGRVSFSYNAKHRKMCIEHMNKITANNSHVHDDIADTLTDAVKFALIDKSISTIIGHEEDNKLPPLIMQNTPTRIRGWANS